MIALEHVSLVRGNRTLVRDATCALRPGALTVMLGANGAGKTSLVRLMSGELEPNRGRVTCSCKSLAQHSRTALARCRAVVSQHTSTPFAFRALDLVLLGRLPHSRFPSVADFAIAREAMEQAGVTEFAERKVDTLSGGERQRVHLARALAQLHEARSTGRGLLLLDEPTAHLDLAHQRHALDLARTIASEGLTVLAVLHDVNLAATYADEALLMKDGCIHAIGPAREVLTLARLRETLRVELEEIPRANGPSVFVPTRTTAA
ncbi:MAG: ATP-binding cassette domain-containing protein [Verrucomicrobia bacterium]|nr:ATP-binding cassette domain-containing protein [Kiritimatiellia bacterium]MCO6401326.1 ATP-binding cassette domain-containing protein [Verrucomicrobiota bacterium]